MSHHQHAVPDLVARLLGPSIPDYDPRTSDDDADETESPEADD